MIGEKIGHRFDRELSQVARAIFGQKVNPHFLTFIGLLFNIGAGICLGLGVWVWGGCLIVVGGVFDVLDGAVARAFNRETKFGGFLDSVVDRYSDATLLIGIIWYYAERGALGYTFLALIVLMGALLIPYARAKAEIFLSRCNIGLIERGERTILLALGSLFTIMPIVLWVLAVLTHVTVIQRIHYTWKEMKRLERQPGAPQ